MQKLISLTLVAVMICVALLATPLAAAAQTTADLAQLSAQLQMGDPAERAAAAKALGQSRTPEAANLLLARLSLEADAAVGQAIATALGPIADATMLPVLLAALQHDNPLVRWRAATALGYLPDPSALAALGYTVRNDASIARSAAVNALIRIGTAEAAREVVPLLDVAELTAQRHAALTVLDNIGEAAVEPLATALAHPSATLRRNAAEALGWIASPTAIEALGLALRDDDETVRWQAAAALNTIGTAEAKDVLAASIPAARPAFVGAGGSTDSLIVGGALVALALLLGIIFLGGGRSRLSPRH